MRFNISYEGKTLAEVEADNEVDAVEVAGIVIQEVDQMIVKSKMYCCELCGSLIKGECNNKNGRITHIDSCSSYEA